MIKIIEHSSHILHDRSQQVDINRLTLLLEAMKRPPTSWLTRIIAVIAGLYSPWREAEPAPSFGGAEGKPRWARPSEGFG